MNTESWVTNDMRLYVYADRTGKVIARIKLIPNMGGPDLWGFDGDDYISLEYAKAAAEKWMKEYLDEDEQELQKLEPMFVATPVYGPHNPGVKPDPFGVFSHGDMKR